MRISSPIHPKKKPWVKKIVKKIIQGHKWGKKKDQIRHLHLQNMLKIGPNLRNVY